MADGNVAPEEPEFHEILTDRLRLTTLRIEHAERLMPLATNYDVMKWTSHGVCSTIDEAKRWLGPRSLGKDTFNFIVELRDDIANTSSNPDIVGLAGCFHRPEIGYMIHPDYAGRGFATEIVRALIPELFARIPPAAESGTGFDYIEGVTDINNRASQRILEKSGFTFCETVPDPDSNTRGSSDICFYRIARPGKTLEELGFIAPKGSDLHSEAPTPPVQ